MGVRCTRKQSTNGENLPRSYTQVREKMTSYTDNHDGDADVRVVKLLTLPQPVPSPLALAL